MMKGQSGKVIRLTQGTDFMFNLIMFLYLFWFAPMISIFWQTEYPKYTPLLAQILEGLLSQEVEDKIHHYEEVTRLNISTWYI